MAENFTPDILRKIFDSYELSIADWDSGLTRLGEDEPLARLLLELHKYNYLIWHEEDKARRSDVDSDDIALVKRNIDGLNQKRNDAIERVDEWLFNNHFAHLAELDLPMRTETPGSVLDRLSILSLKVFHMREQTERSDAGEQHINSCRLKLRILLQQRKDLQESLLSMLTDLAGGRIRMKVYRQFKMYNDPDLNPQVYGKRVKQTKD